jgi:hypothetical protein
MEWIGIPNSIKSLKLIALGYNKNCEMGGTPRSSTKYQKVAFFLFFFFFWVLVVIEGAFNHANSQWLWSFLDSFFGSFPLSPLSFLRRPFPLAILGRQCCWSWRLENKNLSYSNNWTTLGKAEFMLGDHNGHNKENVLWEDVMK